MKLIHNKSGQIKLRQLTKSITLALLALTAYSAKFIVTTTGDQEGGLSVEVDDAFEINTLRSAQQIIYMKPIKAKQRSQKVNVDTIRLLPLQENQLNRNLIRRPNI